MMRVVLTAFLLVVSALLADTPHPFAVMDVEADGIARVRNTYDKAKAFPNAPFSEEETAVGFRVTAVDMNYNWVFPYATMETVPVHAMQLIAAQGDYTVDTFSIFSNRDISELRLEFSDLRNDDGNVISSHSELSVLEMAPYGKVPRYSYARPMYSPNLKEIKAGEEIDLLLMVNVPEDTPAGVYRGTLDIVSEGATTTMEISLRVADFQIPEAGYFGYFMNGTFYNPKDDPQYRIVQVGFVKENMGRYFDFYKTRRFSGTL